MGRGGEGGGCGRGNNLGITQNATSFNSHFNSTKEQPGHTAQSAPVWIGLGGGCVHFLSDTTAVNCETS